MGRRVQMLAVTCALWAIAAPASAEADAPPGFYGVVTQSRLDASDLERMGAGGVGTLRVNLPWAEIDTTPVPQDYDWAEFDATVASAAREGIVVLPTAYTVPRWVSALEGCDEPPCTITPPHTQVGLNAWRSFLGAAVRRYGPGGLFWTLHAEVPEQPIRVWQIWNEQNSPGFFQPRPSVDRYAALLQAASEAIREQDPHAEVLLGGLFRYPLGGRDGGLRATDFLRQLYTHPGIEASFDGVAIHPYAGKLAGVKHQVRRVIKVVRQAGDSQATFWITEIGWSSGGKATPLNRGRKGQAERLVQAFAWFTREQSRLGLRAVLWYAWRDTAEADSRCKWCARSGLFPVGSLDEPKPAWAAFLSFTGGV